MILAKSKRGRYWRSKGVLGTGWGAGKENCESITKVFILQGEEGALEKWDILPG